MYLIKTAKCLRLFEAVFELIAKLCGISLVYLLFDWFVTIILNKSSSTDDTLLNLLLLPALYVLKDVYIILDPITVKVERHKDKISVTRGLFPQIIDTLEFKSVENTEIITTIFGRYFGYSTIKLYSPGGFVEMPHVYEAHKILKSINRTQKHIAKHRTLNHIRPID